MSTQKEKNERFLHDAKYLNEFLRSQGIKKTGYLDFAIEASISLIEYFEAK